MPTKEGFENLLTNVRWQLGRESIQSQANVRYNSFADSDPLTQAFQDIQADRERNANAWGEADSLTNLAASAVSGASRTVGSILSNPANVEAATLATMPDNVLDAYSTATLFEKRGITRDNLEELKGTADYDELKAAYEVLDQPVKDEESKEGFGQAAAINALDQTTWDQKVKGAVEAKEFAKEVTEVFDISGIVNQENRDEITKDLGNAWENISTAWKSDDVSGLAAAGITLAETVKAVVSNPMAVTEFTAENLPSIALGAVGKVGSLLQAADQTGYALDVYNKAVSDYQETHDGALPDQADLQKMLGFAASAGLAEKVGDTKMLSALTKPRKGVLGFIGSSVGTAVTEGITEGYQSAVEESLSKLDYDLAAKGKEIYTSAVIGAASGSQLATGGKAASAVVGGAKDMAVSAQEARATKKAEREELAKGKLKAKFEKVKESGREDALAVVADDALNILNNEATTPEVKKTVANDLTEIQADATVAYNDLTKELTDAYMSGDEAKIEEVQGRLDAQAKALDNAKLAVQEARKSVALKPAEITTDLEAVKTGDTQAAKRIFGSFKSSPESITPDQAIELADSGSVSKEEAKTLRTYAQLTNTFEGTSKEIYEGGYNDKLKTYMMGIKDYRDMFISGRREEALSGLLNFANIHTAKAKNLEAAYRRFESTGEAQSIDGLVINQKSARLIRNVRKEAQGLSAAYSMLKKGPTDVTTDESVQAQEETQDRVPSPQVENVETTGTDTEPTRPTEQVQQTEVQVEGLPRTPENMVAANEFVQQVMADRPVEAYEELVKQQQPYLRPDQARHIALGLRAKEIKDVLTYQANLTEGETLPARPEVSPLGSSYTQPQEEVRVTKVGKTFYTTREDGSIVNSKTGKPARKDIAEKVKETQEEFDKLDEPVVEDKPFNLAKDSLAKESAFSTKFKVGSNPSGLDTIRDFSASVSANPDLLERFYAGPISEGTRQVADIFTRFDRHIGSGIDAVFNPESFDPVKYPHLLDTDMVKHLMDENGELPANVKTAITVGIYSWVNASAKSAMTTTVDDIRSMFGIDEDTKIGDDLYSLVSDVGTTTNAVKNEIGKAAFASLNFKTTDDALLSDRTSFEDSLGNLAFGVMAHLELIKVSHVSNQALNDVLPEGADKQPKGTTSFTRPIGTNGKLARKLEILVDTNQQDKEFLSSVFGSKAKRPLPSFEVGEVPNQINNSNQKVPARTKAVIKTHMEREHYFEPSVMNIFNKMDETARKVMLGYVTDAEKQTKIKNKHIGIDAANRAIDRELEIADEFYNLAEFEGLDKPFYFDHEIWVNQRMGMANAFNMQGSKIHRFMAYQGGWNTEVDPTNPKQVENFLLTIGESLDIVSDKQSQAISLEKTKAKLELPEIRKGIDEIKKALSNQEFDSELIQQAVKKGEAKMHSFAGLVAYANFELAGNNKFTYSLFRECDGITNAAGFTSLQFPHTDVNQRRNDLARTGMFFSDTNYAEYRNQKGTLDSYEALADNWEKNLTTDKSINPIMLGAATNILGSFRPMLENSNEVDSEKISKDGRNAAKSPLMTTIYGAGIKGVVDGFAEGFIDKFYDKLETAINTEDTATINNLLGSLNTLAGTKYTLKDATLEFNLNKNEVKRLKTAVAKVYQPSLEAALEASFGEIFAARDVINTTVQTTFEMFNRLYEDKVNTVLAASGQKELTVGQNKQILAELQTAMPIVSTLMSRKLDEGMVLAKSEVKVQNREETGLKDNENPYFSKTDFKIPIKGVGEGGKAVKRTETFGSKRDFAPPGVMALPLMVQSMDATTMLRTMMGHGILNVHDAIGIGDNGFEAATQTINQKFYETNAQYSIMREVAKMSQRVMAEYEKSGLSFDAISVGKDAMGREAVEAQIAETVMSANMYERRKQETLKDLVIIGQYFDGETTVYRPNAKASIQQETAIKDAIQEPTVGTKTNGQLFGSSYEKELDNIDFEPSVLVDKLSTTATYDKLQESSVITDEVEHEAQLRKVLENLVNKVVTPFNLHLGARTDGGTIGVTDGTDMYIVNQMHQPNSPSKTLNGSMSNGEVFVHELVHNVTQVGLQTNPFVRKEIDKLWQQAKKVVKPEHFLPEGLTKDDPTFEQEYEIAKSKYDHIFSVRNDSVVDGKIVSNHLHEFVAFGLTNAKFREQLSKIPYTRTKRAVNQKYKFLQKLEELFNKVLDSVLSRIYKTRGKSADRQLDQLSLALANVDSDNKRKLKDFYNKMSQPVAKVNDEVRQVRNKFQPEIDRLKNYSAIASKPMFDTTQRLISNFHKEYSSATGLTGLMATGLINLVQESRGRYAAVGKYHDLKRLGNAVIDQAREMTRAVTTTSLEKAFTRKITDREQKALTFALGKTDAQVILDRLGEEQFRKIMTSKAELGIAVARTKQNLKEYPDFKFYTTQAQNLGRFMTTGKNSLTKGLLNADNISKLYGTGKDVPMWAKDARDDIDLLASLYAVTYLSDDTKKVMKDLLETESDGIKYSMNMMKAYRDRAAVDFKDNNIHQIKGYMHDITNPDISLKVGTKDDIKQMAKEGYSLVHALVKDVDDPTSKPRYLFKNMHGGNRSYLAGISYLQTDAAKGTSFTDIMTNPQENLDLETVGEEILFKKDRAAAKEYTGTLTGKEPYKMIPLLNANGQIIDYRYVMDDATKDDLLQRETSFFNLMGVMEGNLVAKQNIPEQNRQVVKAIKEQFDADYAANSSLYVNISPLNADQRYREIYAQLPYKMREEILKVFGRGGMPVRRDQLNLLFGYRKASIADAFYRTKEGKTAVASVIRTVMTTLFGNAKINHKIYQGENLIQEMVKATKDIIIIKSGIVTIVNTMSNMSQLWLHGVPVNNIGSDYAVAWEGLRQYKTDSRELGLLKNDLEYKDLSVSERLAMEERVLRLEDNLNSNPVGDLVGEGILSNIVDDLSVKKEDFTVKGGLMQKLAGTKTYNKVVGSVPQPMKDIASEALIMQGSTMYEMMNFGAQFSDFGARYVLYKHYVNNKGISPEVAVGKVVNNFINYDLPQGKFMQYLNDVGVLWFTKYLIRIQKIILDLFKEHPARVLALITANNILGGAIPNVVGSSILATSPLSRVSDPISMVMGASNDIATLKAVGSIY